MAVVILPKKPRHIVPSGARVDWGHPLAQGLIHFFTFLESPRTVARNLGRHGGLVTMSLTGSPDWTPGIHGMSFKRAASNGRFEWGSAPLWNAPYTHDVWFKTNDVTTYSNMYKWTNDETAYPGNYVYNNQFLWYHGSGAYRYSTTKFNSGDEGKWFYGAIYTHDTTTPSNWEIYVNGVEASGTAGGGAGYINPTAGGRIGRDAAPFDGAIELIRIWTRRLRHDEILWLYHEPFAMLLPQAPVRRYFIGVSVTRTQEGFRFRDDDGSETSATWLDAQDTNVSRAKNANTRLRMLTDTTGDAPSEAATLQYRKQGDPDSEWRDVPL